MIDFENTIVIQRPVEDVFAFIADFENLPKWNYYVMRVQQTSGDSGGEGTTYHQVRKSDQQDFKITEYRTNERLKVKSSPASEPKFERTFRFMPVNNGTRLIDTWRLDLGRNPLVNMLGKPRVKSAVADNLGKLKQLLETGHTQLQDGRTMKL